MKRLSLFTLIIALLCLPAALPAQDTPLAGAEAIWALFGWTESEVESGSENGGDFAALIASLPHTRLNDGGFLLGDPSARVTIIEFADWACSHCQNYAPVIHELIETYVASGQVNYEFRMFPTAGGVMTMVAAQAAECADAQREGGFWDAYQALFDIAMYGDYANAPEELAQALDLNTAELLICIGEAEQVLTDTALAVELGVSATPSVRVRVNGGDPQVIRTGGAEYSAGGVPLEVLEQAIAIASDS